MINLCLLALFIHAYIHTYTRTHIHSFTYVMYYKLKYIQCILVVNNNKQTISTITKIK